MLVVGLTGGVASGKSTVSKVLKEEGAYLIDADQIARELVQLHTPAWHELIKAFGKKILQKDGSIDRKRLAAIVFSDRKERNRLNQLLHPRIQEEIEGRLTRIRQTDPGAVVVVDAALLVETGQYRQMDQVVVVRALEGQQIERLEKRDGMSRSEARRIVASQMTLKEKLKRADRVISNEGPIEQTRAETRALFQQLKRMASEKV